MARLRQLAALVLVGCVAVSMSPAACLPACVMGLWSPAAADAPAAHAHGRAGVDRSAHPDDERAATEHAGHAASTRHAGHDTGPSAGLAVGPSGDCCPDHLTTIATAATGARPAAQGADVPAAVSAAPFRLARAANALPRVDPPDVVASPPGTTTTRILRI